MLDLIKNIGTALGTLTVIGNETAGAYTGTYNATVAYN